MNAIINIILFVPQHMNLERYNYHTHGDTAIQLTMRCDFSHRDLVNLFAYSIR